MLLDNVTAYLTDYTTIQQVSLNKFVFMHGHSVSNVIDSTHTLCLDFRSIGIKNLYICDCQVHAISVALRQQLLSTSINCFLQHLSTHHLG